MNPLFQLIIMYSLSTSSLTAALLHYTQPFFLLGMRMTIAGILLLSYLFLRQRIALQKKHSHLYVHIILFTIFIPYALRYYGLQYATTSWPSLLYNLGPIVTFFLTHFVGIEKITWQRTLAVSASLVGLLLCLDIPLSHYLMAPFGLAEYALLLSLISFSYGWIMIRRLIIDLQYNPLLVNGIAMLGGGVLGLLASICVEPSPYMSNYFFTLPLLMATVIISNIVGHNLYAALLSTYSLTLLQLGYWLIPASTKLATILSMQAPLYLADVGAVLLLFFGFSMLYVLEMRAVTKSFHQKAAPNT